MKRISVLSRFLMSSSPQSQINLSLCHERSGYETSLTLVLKPVGAFTILFDTECPSVVFQTVADCVEHYYMTKPFDFNFEEVSRTLTWRLRAHNGQSDQR